jgi:hypothetical protein
MLNNLDNQLKSQPEPEGIQQGAYKFHSKK